MSAHFSIDLAPAGSTGNNSHNAVGAGPPSGRIALEFNAEAVGATPTVTYSLQGSMQDSPGSNDWEAIALIPPGSDTPATTRAVTAVGRTVNHMSQGQSRFFKKYRLVTTANTNVTYSAKLWQHYG